MVSKKGKDDAPAVVEETEKPQEDIDTAFQETVDRAMKKIQVNDAPEQPTMDVSDSTEKRVQK
jgi:chitin synthase